MPIQQQNLSDIADTGGCWGDFFYHGGVVGSLEADISTAIQRYNPSSAIDNHKQPDTLKLLLLLPPGTLKHRYTAG